MMSQVFQNCNWFILVQYFDVFLSIQSVYLISPIVQSINVFLLVFFT